MSHSRLLNHHNSAVRISSFMYVSVFLISLFHFIIYDPVGNTAQLGMRLLSGRWVRQLLPPKPCVCPVLHDEFVGMMMLDQVRHPCLVALDGMSFIASNVPTLNSLFLCHFKRSALSSMSKIPIASFSSSNPYLFGHPLTAGFRAPLWRHQSAERGRSSHSLCFTYRTFTVFYLIFIPTPCFRPSLHFYYFCSLSQNLYFIINSVISFSLSHFCTINSITFWNFPQNYNSGFNSAPLVTNRTEAVSHENS